MVSTPAWDYGRRGCGRLPGQDGARACPFDETAKAGRWSSRRKAASFQPDVLERRDAPQLGERRRQRMHAVDFVASESNVNWRIYEWEFR